MKKKSIFAGLWGTALMLAAVFTLGFMLSSCGSDDDDNDKPYAYTNQAIVNGVTDPILRVGVDVSDLAEGNYEIRFDLKDDGSKFFLVQLSGELHDGKIIDLSKKEELHNGKWYWRIDYGVSGITKILAYGQPGGFTVFKSGTMYVKRIGKTGTEFEVRIKGTVVGTDKVTEYNIDLNWKGKAKEL